MVIEKFGQTPTGNKSVEKQSVEDCKEKWLTNKGYVQIQKRKADPYCHLSTIPPLIG